MEEPVERTKKSTNIIIIVCIVVFFLIAMIVSMVTLTQEKKSPQKEQVEEKVEESKIPIIGTVLSNRKTIVTPISVNYTQPQTMLDEPSNAHLVKVTFKIKNITNEEHEISYIDFTLIDEYTQYTASIYSEMGGFDSGFSLVLLPNKTYTLSLVYDIKSSIESGELKFRYKDNYFDKKYMQWNLVKK